MTPTGSIALDNQRAGQNTFKTCVATGTLHLIGGSSYGTMATGQTRNLNPTRIRFYSEAEYIEVKPALFGSSVNNIDFYGFVNLFQKSFMSMTMVFLLSKVQALQIGEHVQK